jgi:hypothetical protein
MNSINREWREGKVRPVQGNSPHDRPVGRVFFRQGEFATIPSPPLPFRHCKEQYAGAWYAFLRHGGIYLVRCGFNIKTKPWGGTVPPPVGRPRTQVEERAGRITLSLIVHR